MGSSRSHPRSHSSPPLSVSSGHESSLHASRLLVTTPAVQRRIMYVRSLAEGRKSGVRSVVGFGQCKPRRRVGSTPSHVSHHYHRVISIMSYPHGSIQRPCNLIVLLQAWAATQHLRKPKLTDGPLHVANLALGRRWCFDPL